MKLSDGLAALLFFVCASIGLFFSRVLILAFSLFFLYMLLHGKLLASQRPIQGLCALIFMVLSARYSIEAVGQLLLPLHDNYPPSPELWVLPFFMIFLVFGELLRQKSDRRLGLIILLCAFIALLVSAAALMLSSPWTLLSPAFALILLIPLLVRSGIDAYRVTLFYIQSIA